MRKTDARKTPAPDELLSKGLETLGLPSGPEVIGAFMLYMAELKKWNRTYSITSIRDDHDIVISHFLDSALYLKGLDDTVGSLADVGSGGGFPGIPIKILMPRMEVALIEPTQKKATFLRMLIRRLRLSGVSVINSRLEEVEGLEVDVAVTRALFSAGELYHSASRIVRPGGRMVLSKGPRYVEEIQDAGFDFRVMDIDLPFSNAQRHIIIINR